MFKKKNTPDFSRPMLRAKEKKHETNRYPPSDLGHIRAIDSQLNTRF